MRKRAMRWVACGGVLLSLVLGACGGGGGGGGGGPPPPTGTGRITGTLLFESGFPPLDAVLEAEPNDTPDTAHYLGELTAGRTIVVHGHTTAESGIDPFDGFELLAPARVRVTATLEFPAAGNDFDMGVFDLTTLHVVENFLAVSAPEVGVFHAKGAFDLVVNAYAGSGDYVLTIVAEAPASPIPEREPNEEASEGQWLGEVVPGDTVTVGGLADRLTDRYDTVLVTCPSSARISLSLAFPAGDDYDLLVYDATASLSSPTFLAAFDTPDANPESGSLDVLAGSLLAIHVDAFSGFGPWTLRIDGGGSTSTLAKMGRAHPGSIASLEEERGRWKGVREGPCFGRPRDAFRPGEALVGWRDAGRGAEAASLGARAAKPVGATSGGYVRLALDLPPGASDGDRARATLARIAALKSMPGVAYAEPNRIRRALLEPNDAHYNLQWHYAMIHLPEAWNVTVGSASVIVAVIDTGRTHHPDLAGRQTGGYDFISDPSVSADGDGIDPDPTDVGDAGGEGGSSFHGTHVAGTIGAATNNSRGVAGVTWQSQIMHLRVLGVGGGYDSDIAEAIRYAARLPNASGTLPPQRANVINMSLGGPGPSQTMQDACAAARAAGVLVCAAAGNEGSSEFFVPAGLPGVIGVSAVDARRVLAPYSNFGPSVDIAAPGGDTSEDRNGDGYPDGVLSTLYDDWASPAEPVYDFYQGTSMATPHVAGVAALVYAVAPTLTPSQVETILFTSADDLGLAGRDDRYGHGLVNAYRAVVQAQGGPVGSPVLALHPTTLNLGSAQTLADVIVANGGGGLLAVGTPAPTTQDGAPWLSASLLGAGDATKNVSQVRVAVSRTGLADGSYSGRVTVPSNGGTVEIQVVITVTSTTAPPPDVDLYVLAVDGDTFETVAETKVNPQSGLDFDLTGLPDGSYYVFAGSDEDGDDFICDDGEWCGAWPVQGEPSRIEVVDGQVVTGISFVVGPDLTIGSASAGGRCSVSRR